MIEKLTDDRNKARRGLESETTETLTSQIELEKLAEEFKRAHSDRQGTIIIYRLKNYLTVAPYFETFSPSRAFFRNNFCKFCLEFCEVIVVLPNRGQDIFAHFTTQLLSIFY